ncbi:MAG: flagellar hook-basal body protein [Christensenellaceae bacterium]|jgi:flagellar basal-body rod protein FlgG
MMQGGYTAALGIRSQQTRLDTIANNLANINTNGFKASRVDFKDALYETMQRVVQPQDTLNMQRGHGVLVSGINRVFTQGQIYETGVETDLYIQGDGFFAVQSHDGQTYYTRDGNFQKSLEGANTYLVTSQGYYVLDTNGQRVTVDNEAGFNVSSNGQIARDDGTVYGTLRIVQFPNERGLEAHSENLFRVTENSGEPTQIGEETKIIQGAYEGSNVELAQEMARMVRASRAYQLSARALSVADSMDDTAIRSRR